MKLKIGNPTAFDSETLENIKNLIVSGGQVSQKFINVGISKALLIGCVHNDDEIISTASIKKPSQSYIANVFKNANIVNDLNIEYEYGYNVTNEAYRRKGYTTKLISELLSLFKKPLFSTVRNDNYMSKVLLERHGFVRVGEPWRSSNGDYDLILMINPIGNHKILQKNVDPF